MKQRTLVIMVKEPRAGRVKTRLGRGIGMVPAALWFRRQANSLLRRVRHPEWHCVLAVSPDRAGLTSRTWPRDLPRIPQGQGNLGDRMGRILRSMPPGPVCIIGADIPGIERTHIHDAFRALGRSEAVVGPADDGGYWLIGLRRSRAVPRGIFDKVRWSTEHALADTLATLQDHSVAQIDTLTDIDTAADLRRWHSTHWNGVPRMDLVSPPRRLV